MTFSLIGRCQQSGQIGAAVVCASIAGSAAVAYCEAGVGAVLTQHRTDPRLGPRGLAMLRAGCTAAEAAEAVHASTAHRDWRQIAVLDAAGNSAARSGNLVKTEMSEAPAQDACAIGCGLASALVPAALLHSFQSNAGLPLPERLMRALEAGRTSGGEARPSRSARLLVVERHSFPLVDLRVDWHDEPVAELRLLWERLAPLSGDYLARALDPQHARLL